MPTSHKEGGKEKPRQTEAKTPSTLQTKSVSPFPTFHATSQGKKERLHPRESSLVVQSLYVYLDPKARIALRDSLDERL